MLEIYCHGKKHVSKGLCEECTALLDYAYQRLDHCKFGENKPTCKKCPIHCYKPDMKEKMREAMRYAGPRMMWYHPVAAIRHLIRELPEQREQSEARFNYAESRQKKAEGQLPKQRELKQCSLWFCRVATEEDNSQSSEWNAFKVAWGSRMETRERFLVASFAADCREGLLKMKELHLTQKALAERMNCTQQYVSKILKGKEYLSLDTMTRLEEALEISLVSPEVKNLWEASHKLFKQIKQNFPLRYFYGESSNAIKIQIWVTLIANLLMTLLQQSLKRRWSFSGLATMVRIVLMYYINLDSFLESPDEDLKRMLSEYAESQPEDTEKQ